MATTPNKDKVPSNAVQNLLFNSEKMDEVINSESYDYVDRLGKNRRTLAGIEHDASRAMLNYGYITKDDFESGNTLFTPNTILRWRFNGEYYRWDGDWSGPKVVPAGSTPMSTGGPISPEKPTGLWTSVGDAALRTSLGAINKKFIGTEFMIADTTLSVGNVVETSSFKFNAGEMPFGGAKYRIGASGTADGMSVFRLGNGLFAAAMFEGGEGNITQFGARPGVDIDNSAIINRALRQISEVTVPIGQFYITKTVYVPRYKKLTFAGGYGNGNTAPESSLVKSADFVGNGIEMAASTILSGGGIQGRPGNQGDGLHVNGNLARVENFEARWMGGDGIRVGCKDTYTNCNSSVLDRVYAWQCVGDGIKIHDESSPPGVSDANLIMVLHCHASWNGGSAINVKKSYWSTIQNCSGHGNGEWGLNISGLPDGTYPEARYTQVIGGDFNEGNTLGSMRDEGYFSNIVCGDRHMTPADTRTALQGSGVRNVISPGVNQVAGLAVKTYTGQYPAILDCGTSSTVEDNDLTRKRLYRVIGAGVNRKIQFSIIVNAITPPVPELTNFTAFKEEVVLESGAGTYGNYKVSYSVLGNDGFVTPLEVSALYRSVCPGEDASFALGRALRRWNNIYAATSTITTSDATLKIFYDIEDKERQVAKALKPLIRKYKLKSAIAIKGEADARYHFGVSAQEVCQVFTEYGLDPFKYGMVGRDTDEITGEEIYSVRYEELLCFLMLAL